MHAGAFSQAAFFFGGRGRFAVSIAQPLPPQATTTPENRLEKGIAAQAEIFGEGMRAAWQKSHINR